jgi:hypothetical protein
VIRAAAKAREKELVNMSEAFCLTFNVDEASVVCRDLRIRHDQCSEEVFFGLYRSARSPLYVHLHTQTTFGEAMITRNASEAIISGRFRV